MPCIVFMMQLNPNQLRNNLFELLKKEIASTTKPELTAKVFRRKKIVLTRIGVKPIVAFLLGKRTTDYGAKKLYSQRIKMWKTASKEQRKSLIASGLFTSKGQPLYTEGFLKGQVIEPTKSKVCFVYFLYRNRVYSASIDYKKQLFSNMILMKNIAFLGKIIGEKVEIYSPISTISNAELDLKVLKPYYVDYDAIEEGITQDFGIIKCDILDIQEVAAKKKIIFAREGSSLKEALAWADKDIEVNIGRNKLLFCNFFKTRIGFTNVTVVGSYDLGEVPTELKITDVVDENARW